LLDGAEPEIGGMFYKIEGGGLLWRTEGSRRIRNGKSEDVWFTCDLTVNQFLRMAERIPDKDLFVIGAEGVLSDINRGTS
jgi:hypothetical protein